MLYLSKGVVCKKSTDNQLRIARGNTVITISGTEAEVWLNGRFEIIRFAGDASRTDIVKETLIKYCAQKAQSGFSSDVIKFRRHTHVCQEILVQNDGKYASLMRAKPAGVI